MAFVPPSSKRPNTWASNGWSTPLSRQWTVIWTVGFRASPLTEHLTSDRDPQGRLHVDENLKVLGQTHVYAAGDVAYAATDDLGNFAADRATALAAADPMIPVA